MLASCPLLDDEPGSDMLVLMSLNKGVCEGQRVHRLCWSKDILFLALEDDRVCLVNVQSWERIGWMDHSKSGVLTCMKWAGRGVVGFLMILDVVNSLFVKLITHPMMIPSIS